MSPKVEITVIKDEKESNELIVTQKSNNSIKTDPEKGDKLNFSS